MKTALETLRELRAVKAPEDSPPVRQEDAAGRVPAEFAQAGRVLRLRSDVLEEEVLIASDNAQLQPGETRVVYRASELTEIWDIQPSGLRFLHQVKSVFPGSTIVS